jgi:uncharacterized Zn finger protein
MSYSWRPYVPVAARRAKAHKEMEKLRKKGKNIQPLEVTTRKIASSFWGKGWCDHLESFSDYENRLPRGRTYVRNGSVCHLEVKPGEIEALVSGSQLYRITINIEPLARNAWKTIKAKCRGQIGSMLELLQGKISSRVMEIVSDRKQGLFPKPGEITLKCSCPDWATMCKHVAAVLYGIGTRLDHHPELLFLLRGVDAEELISAEAALSTGAAVAATEALAESALGDIFGIDLDTGDTARSESAKKRASTDKRGVKRTKEDLGSASNEAKPKPAPTRTALRKPSKKASPKTKKKRSPKPPAAVFDPQAPTGVAIARLRQVMGLSVADFAQALGVTVASVQRWESIPGPLRLYARPLAALTRMQEQRAGH